MKWLVIATTAAALVLSACTDGETAVPQTTTTTTVASTTTLLEPSPAADISEAVGAAAQALLDESAIQAMQLRYDEAGVLQSTVWLDWRATGGFTLVAAGRQEVGAVTQVGQDLRTAAADASSAEPWAVEEPPLPTATDPGVLLAFDLAGLAGGSLVEEVAEVPSTDIEVESAAIDDGGTRWTMRLPFGEATAIREWTIDADGVLRSYALSSDAGGPLFGAFATSEFRFDPVPDAAPITLPEVGTELDVSALLPPDVPLPGP